VDIYPITGCCGSGLSYYYDLLCAVPCTHTLPARITLAGIPFLSDTCGTFGCRPFPFHRFLGADYLYRLRYLPSRACIHLGGSPQTIFQFCIHCLVLLYHNVTHITIPCLDRTWRRSRARVLGGRMPEGRNATSFPMPCSAIPWVWRSLPCCERYRPVMPHCAYTLPSYHASPTFPQEPCCMDVLTFSSIVYSWWRCPTPYYLPACIRGFCGCLPTHCTWRSTTPLHTCQTPTLQVTACIHSCETPGLPCALLHLSCLPFTGNVGWVHGGCLVNSYYFNTYACCY